MVPTVTSQWNQDASADLARFRNVIWGSSIGWCASNQNLNQYFQVGSFIPFVYEGLKMSGRMEFNQWIYSYKLNYSLDGFTWLSYKNSRIFIGNSNSREQVENIFDPFVARSVRIIPQSWKDLIGGSFEFFISKPIYSNILPSNTLIPAVASGCKLTSSSVWSNACTVLAAGYDIQSPKTGCTGWCAGVDNIKEWIMITSAIPVKWKRIGTMGEGSSDQRINSYYITYSDDGVIWQDYKNKKVFIGNTDRITKVEYDLEEFIAISIRLHPLTWNIHIFTKIEAYFILV